MKIKIIDIAHHRNGICGAEFEAIVFHDAAEGRMLGIVFKEPFHVAVFNIDKLTTGNIKFGDNSWRGDRYEPFLRRAIARHKRASRPTNEEV